MSIATAGRRRALTRTSAVIVAALTASTLFTSVAAADDADPAGDNVEIVDDAGTVSLDEEGLFELEAPAEGVQARNFTSEINGWVPGSKESRHWSDNDYTEVKFTNCSLIGTRGKSLDITLWQAIPFGLDKSVGTKRFSECFKGSGHTSRGEWDAHYSNGDNRYFTIPRHNGSEHIRTYLNVKKVYVDVSKAD